jgi:hypothetical protein
MQYKVDFDKCAK